MKIVLSGSTGYIGADVLKACLEHQAITEVLILTRRAPVFEAPNPKAKVIIMEDFTRYETSTINELKDVDAALWCLGTKTGDERVDIDFPLAFIDAIKTIPLRRTPFRYIQLAGAFTEPPPAAGTAERSLWFYAQGRRIRGRTEVKVLSASDKDFEVYLVKPGGVLPEKGSVVVKWLFGDGLSIRTNELAATMIDLATKGNKQRVFSNREIIHHSKVLVGGL